MVFEICGCAHPAPPPGARDNPADLSAAEIGTTQLGGRPLLNEHQHGARIGTCLASWEAKNGDLRVIASVTDPALQQDIENGKMRGLSLGTNLTTDTNGKVIYRGQAELSVCEEGRRQGTWIDTVNGKSVHRRYNASKAGEICLRELEPLTRITHPGGNGNGKGAERCAA